MFIGDVEGNAVHLGLMQRPDNLQHYRITDRNRFRDGLLLRKSHHLADAVNSAGIQNLLDHERLHPSTWTLIDCPLYKILVNGR